MFSDIVNEKKILQQNYYWYPIGANKNASILLFRLCPPFDPQTNDQMYYDNGYRWILRIAQHGPLIDDIGRATYEQNIDYEYLLDREAAKYVWEMKSLSIPQKYIDILFL